MAMNPMLTALVLLLALSTTFKLSMSQVVKGKISCLDCAQDNDFSEFKVLVKCDHVKKLKVATTTKSGTFEVEIPSDQTKGTASTASVNCEAKLLGGPIKVYVSNKNMVSKIVKDKDTYRVSSPLSFSISCPSSLMKNGKCQTGLDSSKTVDLPLPREWGLAPSSYYVPFIPIIGVP